jgi:hypothetical protein
LLCLDPLRRSDEFSVVCFQSEHVGNDEVLAASPVLAGIACHIELFEVGQDGQALDAVVEVEHVDEVDCHVKFLEAFAALDVLNLSYIVEGQIEVF